MASSKKQAELKLFRVTNDSDPDNEIVRLKVVLPGTTSGFALVDKTFNANDEASNEFRHIFLFPAFDVAKDDIIRIYTGVGDNVTKVVGDNTIHRLYWNSEEAVWNDKGGDKAYLIKYSVADDIDVPKA